MTTSTVTTVPFARLVASDAINARAAGKDGLDELEASIAQRGLIQPLAVRPAGGDRYEVIDGRRRYAAIQRLVKAKQWAKATPIPVLIRNEDDAEALETSLVANTVRLPMHPVDQHAVLSRLVEQGKTVADIATRFGLAERTVRQHLALGRLADPVRKAWRSGTIAAEIAQAFTVGDHAAQEAAWAKLKGRARNASPYGGGLTATDVRRELAAERPAKSRVPAAVLERYLAAGGTVSEDLFADDAYLDDGALAKRLTDEWSAEQAAGLRALILGQGWAWVALSSEMDYGWRWDWQRLEPPGGSFDLSDADNARVAALEEESLAANDRGDEATVDRIAREIKLIEQASEAAAYSAEQRARAGCVLQVMHDGTVQNILCGYVRPSADGQADIEDVIGETDADGDTEPCPDCAGVEPADCDTCGGAGRVPLEDGEDLPGVGAMVGDGDDEAGDDTPAISQALAETLSEARTAAAAKALASDPELAMRVLVAALTCRYDAPAVLRPDGHPSVRVTGTHTFAERLPVLLSTPIAGLTGPYGVRDMLAAAVAQTLDLTTTRWRYKSRDNGCDALVAALPGAAYLEAARAAFLAEDYFKRATKAVIIAALDEMREAGRGDGLAPEDVLADMKKADLAAAAAEAARRCGWLPPELRHPEYALPAPGSAPQRLTGKTAAAEQTGGAA